MPYVYRYVEPDGFVVYVGKTNNLDSRHYNHTRDSWYNDNLEVNFISVATDTEADILETHFIGIYRNQGMCPENTAKASWYGYDGSKYVRVEESEWLYYNDGLPIINDVSQYRFADVKRGDEVYIFLHSCEEERKNKTYSNRGDLWENFDFGDIRIRRVTNVKRNTFECCRGCWTYRIDNGKEVFCYGDRFNGVEAEAFPTMMGAIKREIEWLRSTYGEDRYNEWLHNSIEWKNNHLTYGDDTQFVDAAKMLENFCTQPSPYLSDIVDCCGGVAI